MASTYFSSKYDPNSSSRDNTVKKDPYGYTTKKSYGGYNPTMRSTATHTDDWIKEVYANQFGSNKDNYKDYDRDAGIINEYLNQGNTRENTFERIMDFGLGKANDTDRIGYGEQTYNKSYQDLFNNDYSVNGYRPTMKSTAINNRDWIGDVYRNQFGLNVNDGNKGIRSEQDYLINAMESAGWGRQQAFNWLMQNSVNGVEDPNGLGFGAKKLGTMYDRNLSDAEKKQLMAENNLTANGGFAFNPVDNLQGNTFRNNMYNKGGQYLNDQQRIMNEAEQLRVDNLAKATSDDRFDELKTGYASDLASVEEGFASQIAGAQSEYSKQLAEAQSGWQTDLTAQQKVFTDYQDQVKAEKAAEIAAEKAAEEAASSERAARIKEGEEQNNRNIAGRLSQQTNRTNDYMLYLQQNNKPMYDKIMQSLRSSNPEMYQTIMDLSGAA